LAKHPHNFKTGSSVKNRELSYADEIKLHFNEAAKKILKNVEKTEPLAFLDYNEEIKIKYDSLLKYLKENKINIKPDPIIKSPLPRNYRTTSKRRVLESRGKFYFLFAEESYPTKTDLFRPSLLEPVEHKKIFEYLCAMFNQPGFAFLARATNFVIIRGSYTEFSVTFNISQINADIIKKLKTVSEKLKQSGINIISSFTYYDPTRSEYYFESERPEKEVTFKKFYGPDTLFLKCGAKKFSYHPTSFSQINESIIPLFVEKAEALLKPDISQSFYDLYCGYGLFACSYAGQYRETIGIEASVESIKSAVINAKYLAPKARIKFLAKKITEESLEQCLPVNIKENEVFLLDPPRNGTGKGVIKTIANRNPVKVVHIFCSVDEIPHGITEWAKNGYKLNSLSPMDLFPGSPNLEVLALFAKQDAI
jgi:tRNA/tmRNA/rRNA uracil-C5-methylase (TrmA/RlmC/RlmD family)